jgi:hypothetical protein
MASAIAWGETPLLGLSPQLTIVIAVMVAMALTFNLYNDCCMIISCRLLLISMAFCRHFQTLDMPGGIASKVPVDQGAVCECIHGVTEPMAG